MSQREDFTEGRTYWENLDAVPGHSMRAAMKASRGVREMQQGEQGGCPDGFFQHVIRAGESLITIAQRYGLSLTEMMQFNPDINPHFYSTGQILCIPAKGAPGCPSGSTYTIRQGDTLYAIASHYRVSVEALILANLGIDAMNLQIGQVICIPASAEPAPKPEYPDGCRPYICTRDDTLISLMRQGDFSYGALLECNPDISLQTALQGTELYLPETGSRIGWDGAAGGRAYKMGKGETLETLAQKLGISEEELVMTNPAHTPDDFISGQIIRVPQ